MKFYFFAILLLSTPICSIATTNDKQAIQLSIAAGNLPQQRLEINQKLALPIYTELSQDNRVELNRLLDLLESKSLAGSEAVTSQNIVNEILNKAYADSKLVCTYEQVLGSNMKKRLCMTVAAKQKSYDKTQKALEMQKVPSNPFATN